MAWLLPFGDLSERQQKAVQLDPSQPRFIVGPPGSGKTQILLHRAAHLRDAWTIPSERLRIFVYTNVLKDYIRAGCRDLDIPLKSVLTFDAWCIDYHQRHLGRAPWDQGSGRPDFPATRAAVARHVAALGQPPLDAVLVDEGQDLDHDALKTLLAVAKHVTVCADYKQRIYEHGLDEEGIARALGLSRASMTLLEAHRCSPYLAAVAAAFIADATERSAFVHQCRAASGRRETPVLYEASSADDERRYVIETVRMRLQMGERVAIVLPQTKQVYGFAQACRDAGLEVEAPARRGKNEADTLDFGSDRPKVLTYHGAKGLTFDSAIMPRLVTRSFPNADKVSVTHRLFVGITRAVRWVCLSTVAAGALPLLGRLSALTDAGLLTLRRSPDDEATPVTKAEASTPEESVSDLF